MLPMIITAMPNTGGKKKTSTKPRRKMWRRKGARVALPKRSTGNFASLTEQYSIGVQAGVVYDFTTDLSKLVRSRTIAQGFQYYRITQVEMRFKPLYDNFIGLSSALVPNLHFQYDKSGTLVGLTAAGFEAIGTKAYRLDDKTLVRKWKPSVLEGDANTAGAIGQFKVSPWIPVQETTAPYAYNLPQHYGAIFYIDKMNATDGTVYDVDVVVSTQFRKPNVTQAQQGAPNPNPPVIRQGNISGVDMALNTDILSPSMT